jgi:hypothetical protein
MNIYDKIFGLLTLAKNNSNVNEAAAAFAQAQRLMTRHKISEADVFVSKPEIKKEFIVKIICTVKNVISWKSFLCDEIAKLNVCRFWTGPNKNSGETNFCIAGSEQDIVLVEYLFNSIVNQIEWLCEQARINKLGTGKSYYNSFKLGAVTTVVERLKQSQKEELTMASSSAMVIINRNNQDVVNFVHKLVPNLVTKNIKYRRIDEGMEAGKQAGKRVLLNKGLGE